MTQRNLWKRLGLISISTCASKWSHSTFILWMVIRITLQPLTLHHISSQETLDFLPQRLCEGWGKTLRWNLALKVQSRFKRSVVFDEDVEALWAGFKKSETRKPLAKAFGKMISKSFLGQTGQAKNKLKKWLSHMAGESGEDQSWGFFFGYKLILLMCFSRIQACGTKVSSTRGQLDVSQQEVRCIVPSGWEMPFWLVSLALCVSSPLQTPSKTGKVSKILKSSEKGIICPKTPKKTPGKTRQNGPGIAIWPKWNQRVAPCASWGPKPGSRAAGDRKAFSARSCSWWSSMRGRAAEVGWSKGLAKITVTYVGRTVGFDDVWCIFFQTYQQWHGVWSMAEAMSCWAVPNHMVALTSWS